MSSSHDQSEQLIVDAAYALAEARVAELAQPVEAGDDKAAQVIFAANMRKRDELLNVVHDASRLIVVGSVAFRHGSPIEGCTRLYLGLERLAPLPTPDTTVHDRMLLWSDPRASGFYDPEAFGDGTAVSWKRTLRGKKRVVESVKDEHFDHDVPALVEPSPDPFIELLEEAGTAGRLREVAATIRAEQYRLMARPLEETLVIQGGPGTGKTIIALHRAAMLLYREQERIGAEDLLVVGPSRTYLDYIADVLPQLGQGAVRQVVITDVAPGGVSTVGVDRPIVRAIKGRPLMATLLHRYLLARAAVSRATDELRAAGIDTATAEGALQAARDRVSRYGELRQELETQLSRAGVTGSRTGLGPALERIVPTVSEREAVHGMLTSPELLRSAAEGLLEPYEQTALLRPSDAIGEHPWSTDDLPLIDEARWQLQGELPREERYVHILVDEAQDLSPMQVRMLARRAASMTIVGDIAQATSPWAPTDWAGLLTPGGVEPTSVTELGKGYRTTQAIIDFANALLPVFDLGLAATESVLRGGEEPIIKQCARETLEREVTDSIGESLAGGLATAVIAPRDELAALTPVIQALLPAIASTGEGSAERLVLVDYEDANGLEFDSVILVRPEAAYRSDPVAGPRRLYVALTRARRRLTLLHLDRLPRALEHRTRVAATHVDFETVVESTHGRVEVSITAPAVTLVLERADGSRLEANGWFYRGERTTYWLIRSADGAIASVQTKPGRTKQALEGVIDAVFGAR